MATDVTVGCVQSFKSILRDDRVEAMSVGAFNNKSY